MTIRRRWEGQTIGSDLDDLRRLLEYCRTTWGDPSACGVSFAAMLDVYQNYVVAWPNRPWWENIGIRKVLEEFCNAPVRIEDDASAAAIAEWQHGVARGYANVLVIVVGTGVGAGIISDGRLLRGTHGWAGDIGHLTVKDNGPICSCKRRGCVQAFASTSALLVAAEKHPEGYGTNRQRNFDALKNGEEWTASIVSHAGMALARGISTVSKLLDPEIVVIGGFPTMAPKYFEALSSAVFQDLWMHPTTGLVIKRAILGEHIGLYGGYALLNSNQWR